MAFNPLKAQMPNCYQLYRKIALLSLGKELPLRLDTRKSQDLWLVEGPWRVIDQLEKASVPMESFLLLWETDPLSFVS